MFRVFFNKFTNISFLSLFLSLYRPALLYLPFPAATLPSLRSDFSRWPFQETFVSFAFRHELTLSCARIAVTVVEDPTLPHGQSRRKMAVLFKLYLFAGRLPRVSRSVLSFVNTAPEVRSFRFFRVLRLGLRIVWFVCLFVGWLIGRLIGWWWAISSLID